MLEFSIPSNLALWCHWLFLSQSLYAFHEAILKKQFPVNFLELVNFC